MTDRQVACPICHGQIGAGIGYQAWRDHVDSCTGTPPPLTGRSIRGGVAAALLVMACMGFIVVVPLAGARLPDAGQAGTVAPVVCP